MFASQLDPPDSSPIDPPEYRILSQDDAEFLYKVQQILNLEEGYLRDTCRTKGCHEKLERKHRYCPVCLTARESKRDRDYQRKRAMERVLVKLKGGGE